MNNEEKLKEAKRLYKTATPDQKYVLESLFPELKESEDELEWLKQFIQEEAYSLSMDIRDDEDRFKLKMLQKSLKWLEKQGEQKSIEWSKEDERIYYSLLADIRTKQDGSTSTLEAYYNEKISWLKSLKQRMKGE